MCTAVACSGSVADVADTTPPSTTFDAYPLALSDIRTITALGNLNPPGHTLPTDHVYFYHASNPGAGSFELKTVYAPGSGKVLRITRNRDDAVAISFTSKLWYYLGHIHLDSSITEGQRVQAGQRLGTTSEFSGALDVGLVDEDHPLPGFITRSRYPMEHLYCAKPLANFADSLKDSIYARVQRSGSDKDGKIDYNVIGTLSGDWFHETLTKDNSSFSVDAGPKHLAFVPDAWYPDEMRISIGGTLSMPGVWRFSDTDPSPSDITPASGKVLYHLYYPFSGPSATSVGVMLVQLIAPDQIKAETFSGATTATDFTAAAQIYIR